MSPEHDSGRKHGDTNEGGEAGFRELRSHAVLPDKEIDLVTNSTHEYVQATFFATLPEESLSHAEELEQCVDEAPVELTEEEIMQIWEHAEMPMWLVKRWEELRDYGTNPNLEILIDTLSQDESPNIPKIARQLVGFESYNQEYYLPADPIWRQFLHPSCPANIRLIYGYQVFIGEGLEDDEEGPLLALALEVIEHEADYDSITVSFAERLFCALSNDELMIQVILEKNQLSSAAYRLALKICALKKLPVVFAMELSKDLRMEEKTKNLPPHQRAFAERQCIERLVEEVIEIVKQSADDTNEGGPSFAGIDDDGGEDWRGGPNTSEAWKGTASQSELLGTNDEWLKQESRQFHQQRRESDDLVSPETEGEFDFLLRLSNGLNDKTRNESELDEAPPNALFTLEALALWKNMQKSPQYGYDIAIAEGYMAILADTLGTTTKMLVKILSHAIHSAESVDPDHGRYNDAQRWVQELRQQKFELLGLE